MSDILKCPFCQQELNCDNPQSIECKNDGCRESYFMYGSKELWQELIRTRKALEIARSGLIDIFGYEDVPKYVAKHVRQVLDQSKNETALEQKD